MRRSRLFVLLAVAAALIVAGAVLLERPPDTPAEMCVEQATRNSDDVFTGPVTDDQIEQFCRDLTSGRGFSDR